MEEHVSELHAYAHPHHVGGVTARPLKAKTFV
jgi:hypothetical protein